MSTAQPLRPHAISLAGIVWIVCGLLVLAVKVGFSVTASPSLWEYVGGFMILFGLVRLFWQYFRGAQKTKPRFWDRLV